MDTSTIFQSAAQNILRDAVITCDQAPRATYPLETLGFLRPDWRVVWDDTTLTITWMLTEERQGDIFVLPISNLSTAGSPGASVTLTNDAGLSQVIDVPEPDTAGFPATLALDLTDGTPDAADRTSDVWNLVIVGNPVNVTIGGGISIFGPKTRLLDRDFKWGYSRDKERGIFGVENEYLTEYVQDTLARRRGCTLETLATDQDADALEAWFDGMTALRGLLYVVDFEAAYLGKWVGAFQRIIGPGGPDTNLIRVSFQELSKGEPIKGVLIL